MKRSTRRLIFLAAIVIAGAAAGWWYFGRPMPLDVVRPARGNAVEAVYATGAVEPVFWAKVSSTSVGRIVEIKVKEGQAVKAGDILVRLDDREATARLEEARAALKFLKEELARYAKLAESNIASRQAYQRIVSQHAAAVAAEAAARQRLTDLTLRAPLDGDILRLDGNVGEVVKAGDVLVWVGKCCPMRIEAEVDEEDIPLVKKGQKVLVRADAFPGRSFIAVVGSITPKGDPVSKNYRVRITLPSDTPLRFGMTTEVNIIAREAENALLVPFSAVRAGHVWIVVEGRAKRVPVKTGIVGDRRIQITRGLTGDEAVIADPPAGLKPGTRVAPRRPAGDGAGDAAGAGAG